MSQAWRLLLWLLLAAALIRVPLLFVQGYWYDVLLFRRWAADAYENGLPHLLSDRDLDYLGFTYVLWLIGAVADVFVSGPLAESKVLLQAVKVPGFLGDLAVIPLLFWVTRRWLQRNPALISAKAEAFLLRLPFPRGHLLEAADRGALFAAALYAFNAAALYSSGYWGQTDSLIAFFMLAAIAALLEDRPTASWTLISVGFLIKPQTIVLTPLLGLVTFRSRGIQGLVKGGGAACLTLAAGLSYLLARGLFSRVRDIYEIIFFDLGVRVSVSAWNVWAPVQKFEQAQPRDTLFVLAGHSFSYDDLSRLLILLALGVFVAFMRRSHHPSTLFVAASYLVFAFFMLPMKIHERYLFPLFALLAPAAVLDRRWLFFYVALSLTFTLNLSSLYPIEKSAQAFMDDNFSLAITAVNIALFLAFSALLLRPELRAQLDRLRRRRPAPRDYAIRLRRRA